MASTPNLAERQSAVEYFPGRPSRTGAAAAVSVRGRTPSAIALVEK